MINKEWMPIDDKTVIINNNSYSVYDEGAENERNTIFIEGKTLQLQRDEEYTENEDGYAVEATRTEGNTFKIDAIWLTVEGMGWMEAETIEDEKEILFIQNILKEAGIETLR